MKFLFLLLLYTSLFAEQVAFVSLHPGPAEHFKVFAHALEEEGISSMHIALDKENKAQEVAKKCAGVKVVITEGGDPFFALLHTQLQEQAPFAKRLLYYDNPEKCVPGGYSEAIAEVIASPVEGVVFANLLLASSPVYRREGEEIDLSKKKKWALGYYPLKDVEQVKKRREVRESNPLPTFLYIGGAHQAYYETTLPHFIELLLSLPPLPERCLLLFQQHPRAKREGGLDWNYVQKFLPLLEKKGITLKLSTRPFLAAITEADCVFYSQSSAAPKCLLAKIPLIQIAPQPYEDVLIKTGLIPFISTPEECFKALCKRYVDAEEGKEKLMEALGITEEWKGRLVAMVKSLTEK